MKKYRLHVVMMIVFLCLASGLVFAQDAMPEPVVVTSLPAGMETALIPCGDGVTGPCDLIATKAEDVVGVWAQYLISPITAPVTTAYIRFNADGTFVMGDSIENTAQPNEIYPSGTYRFEEAQLIFDPILTAPEPCNGAGIFQARILKYGDAPVALRYVPISDDCTFRLQDLSQAAVWVSSE